MRRLLTVLFLVSTGMISGQEHFCGTTEAGEKWFRQNPAFGAIFDSLQQQAAVRDKTAAQNGYARAENMQAAISAASSFTIPVVFHILHNGGPENISDAQVQDAVAILSRDFNRENSDTVNVVGAFKGLIGNPSVTFMLATRDPAGNCTNGILRHMDPKTDWEGGFNDYKYSWPSHRYLNIYVVRSMQGGAAGYTYLPGSGIPASMDAIVVLSSYVGSIGSGSVFKSRVLTHEVGHWLDLPHTWGHTNSPGVACGDDGVSDTPVTKGFTSCSLNKADVCNPGVTENVQNYMEYSYCDNMFTVGQAFRMQNTLSSTVNDRDNLSDPANLVATGIVNPLSNCVPKIDILAAPGLTTCSGKPLSFASFTSNANPDTFVWTAGGSAVISAAGSASTNITFNTTGTVTVSCSAGNIYGSSSSSIIIVVKNGSTEIPSGGSESFEGSTLPQFWTVINNGSPAVKWELTGDASSHGVNSMYLAGEKLPANSVEILEGPAYDFKNNPGGVLSFKYAYARGSSANKDVFKVQGSTDCGGTWRDIYYPGNGQMATGSGDVSNIPFVPPVESWKFYNLSAHPNFNQFKNEPHVRIRFYFQEDPGGTGYGNRLYLDEINYAVPTGINELSRQHAVSVFPNPASSGFSISFHLSDRSDVNCTVTSASGAQVLQQDIKALNPGAHQIQFDPRGLAAGLYFVQLEVNGATMSRKLILE